MKRLLSAVSGLFFVLILSLLALPGGYAVLATKQTLPEFTGVTGWMNVDAPKTLKDLQNQVVLIDFWNFSSAGSLRKIKLLKKLHTKYGYDGLTIIGVHSAKFEFEKENGRLIEAVKKLKIKYAITTDPNKNLWKAYNNQKSPVHYLADSRSRIRYVFYEESDYEETETRIQELLLEKGEEPVEFKFKMTHARGAEIPEMHFGYRGLSHFGNIESIKAEEAQLYKLPELMTPGNFYLAGAWEPHEEMLQLKQPEGKVVILNHGSFFYMVMRSAPDRTVQVEVKINGQPLTRENKGKDIEIQEGRSFLTLSTPRLYRILNTHNNPEDFEIEMTFDDSGAEIYEASFA